MRKVKYQNWIYDIFSENDWLRENASSEGRADPEIEKKVHQAISRLSEKEKIFIEQFYFQGRSYKDISQILKLNLKQAEYLHRQATFKLKRHLADFVERKFKIKVPPISLRKKVKAGKSALVCVICQNPKQREIEKIICSKKEYQTWGVILKKLKQKLNLDIKAPQILMGHMKHRS